MLMQYQLKWSGTHKAWTTYDIHTENVYAIKLKPKSKDMLYVGKYQVNGAWIGKEMEMERKSVIQT